MVRKARTSPRKQASQERSRITVDALLEATARILVKEGYEGASTNKIAQTAGVSIGSLYQYFPAKEALVAAVIDRHMQAMLEVVRDALVTVADQPIEVVARQLVTVMIDAHRVNPTLHRVLFEQIPQTGRVRHIEALDNAAFAMVRAYLEAHRDEVAVEDLDLAAFICVKTVEVLTHTAVLNQPERVKGGKAAALIEEITRLLVGYLRGGHLPRRTTGSEP
ncbi:MAG TPA: TetR/AcrR family transcriptional regulator [Candidatus Aquabacterium excrementipullorum]|nr:TetR/AcrR family transcriptional regulator [Candidatus Aquabacterium excrementipullorum]